MTSKHGSLTMIAPHTDDGQSQVSSRFAKRCTAIAALALLLVAAPARAALPDPVRFSLTIELGNIAAVRAWLDEGLDPNFLGDRIGTGLMIAAWEGNLEMMELLLSRGADINATNTRDEQALMHAAWKGRLDAVRWLLDRGARINRPGKQWSALHYAVFAGHEDVAQLLIDRGADVNARSSNGSSVLMMAAREGREAVAKTLLALGADTGTANDRGEDALLWALRHERIRIAALVGSPERLAEAVRRPRDPAAPMRSRPIPERIETLLKEMRAAEAEGRLTEEMRTAYRTALAELEKTRAAAAAEEAARAAAVPKLLEITARRAAPAEQEATLVYERGAAQPVRQWVEPRPPAARKPPAVTRP